MPISQIIFFAIVAIILLLLTQFEHYIINFYYNRLKWQTKITAKEYYRYSNYLKEGLPYFKKLSPNGKAKFVSRLKSVLSSKHFEGMQGLKVDEKMKIIISGLIVQITFGLKNFDISHFTLIRIFPEQFYSRLHKQDLKGGATKTGILLLSWKDILEGIRDENDKINLGLHEIGHALKLNVIEGSKFDLQFSSYLDRWLEISKNEFWNIRTSSQSFLRAYAGSNMHEFFAVSMEHFFEAPKEFKSQLPDIYNHMCMLLNQDPINEKNDYLLATKFKDEVNADISLIPLPNKIISSGKYLAWHWTYSVMLVGIFFAFPGMAILQIDLAIQDDYFLKLFGISIGIAFTTQFWWILKEKILNLPIFVFYCVGGFSPVIICLLFILNNSITIESIHERYAIKQKTYLQDVVIYRLEDNAYAQWRDFRTFDLGSAYHKKPKYVEYEFKLGIMGFKKLVGKSVEY